MTLQRADDEIDAVTSAAVPVQDSDEPPPRGPRRRLTARARWLLIGALVLLLAGGGFGVWALFFRTSDAATTTLRTVTVAQEALKQTVSGTGTLNPATESDLSFASSGTVTSVEVEPGDLVSKGDELAAIDDSELEIDYESAKASRTEAEEALSTLEDDDDATDTAIAAAKATVKVRKNAVTQARTALDKAVMVSPISGKVATVTIAEGDTVSGGSSTSGASSGSTGTSGGTGTSGTTGSAGSTATGTASSSTTAAVTVISNGTFLVTTSVSNADVTSIKKGLQATITPTSSSEPVFGTVSTVGVVASSSTSAATGSGSATFPVTIKVTGTHKDLLPGSSATVAITVKQLSDVISLPTQAVTTVDGKTVVQKLVNGKQVATEVTLGASLGASTVITQGLAVGDEVVLTSFRGAGAGGSGQGTRTGGTQVGTGTQGGTGGFPAGGFPAQPPGTGNQAGTR